MKKTLIILVTALTGGLHLCAQNYQKLVFTEYLDQHSKSAGQLYLVKTGYPTTGLVVSIASTDSLTGAFIVVGNDTTYLKPDEDTEPGDVSLYSNLLTFQTPIDSFYFYPGNITSEITFYLINASQKKESVSTGFLNKKKVPYVQNPIWWTNRSGEPVCRHRITSGSISRYLI